MRSRARPRADQTPLRPAPQRERHEGLWRQRDFRLLWIGQGASKLGSAVTTVSLPLIAVLTLHTTAFGVGVLEAAVWLPWLIVGLPAGALVDRWAPRPVMVVCDLASLLLLGSVPAAAWFGMLTFPQLVVVALLAGAAGVFFSTAYQVLLPSLLAPADLPEGNARMQGTEAAAQVAGPGLGGLLAQLAGPVLGLLMDTLSFAVSALCLRRITTTDRRPPRDPAAGTRSLRGEISEGLGFLVRDPYLRSICGFSALTNLTGSVLQAVLVVFLLHDVGLSPGVVGGLLGTIGLGGVLGATVATRITRRFGTARGLLLCNLCTAPAALLVPLTGHGPRLVMLVAGGLLTTAGVIAFNVIFGSFRAAYVPSHLLGRVVAGGRFVNYSTIPVGALLGGSLGTLLGLRPTVWIAAAGTALSVAALLAGPVRHGRDLPTAPAVRTEPPEENAR
ncbi:MFS transporter [Kitasatospora sp. NPDC059327]|uniref:MFS transporter n=1 Tax=Kitasatospora sp. NPDC059327 TaxID=3346803 RepID=UPI0036A95EF1